MFPDVTRCHDEHTLYFTFFIDRMDKAHEYSVYFPDRIGGYNVMYSDAQFYQCHCWSPIYLGINLWKGNLRIDEKQYHQISFSTRTRKFYNYFCGVCFRFSCVKRGAASFAFTLSIHKVNHTHIYAEELQKIRATPVYNRPPRPRNGPSGSNVPIKYIDCENSNKKINLNLLHKRETSSNAPVRSDPHYDSAYCEV
jgi:hypothetical protein